MATALLRHPFQTMRSVALSSILVLNVLRVAEAGTVLLGGDDLTEHGRFNATTGENEQGWKYIEHAMAQLIADSTFPGRDGSVALLGSHDSNTTGGYDAGAAYHWAAYANDNTLVRYYDGDSGVYTFLSDLHYGEVKPSLVALAGSEAPLNNLEESESNILTQYWYLLKSYIDDGGSLMSHAGGHVYGWLSKATNVTEMDGCKANGAYLTTDGRAMFPQLRNSDINIYAGPCHTHFENASGFETLAKDYWGRDYIIMSRGAIEEIPTIRVNCSDETMTAQAGTWHASARNSWNVSFSVPRQTHGRDFERFMQTALNNDDTFRARRCRASHPGVLQIAMPRENVAEAKVCFESDCWPLEEFTGNGLDCPSTPTCPECDGVAYSAACDQNGKLYPNECTLNRLACLFPGEPLELTECPPTPAPTVAPTATPPTPLPTLVPTYGPTSTPTFSPTPAPTDVPTPLPTPAPTFGPTPSPTVLPTPMPTYGPSPAPTNVPTPTPTFGPTPSPTVLPTPMPTGVPTPVPTDMPTPTPTGMPSPAPTDVPTPVPTNAPSPTPTAGPTPAPTNVPSPAPTNMPTPTPTDAPTPTPTDLPTPVPTVSPTPMPTNAPTPVPTYAPTPVPTDMPTPMPTGAPTPVPTALPTPAPTQLPTPVPTDAPTPVPTDSPTPIPTDAPSPMPTSMPSPVPTDGPTPVPTDSPTPSPTVGPTPVLTSMPSPVPTNAPTPTPTAVPTVAPTAFPTPAPAPWPTTAPTQYTDAPTTVAATDLLFTAFPTPEVTASPTPAPVEPTRPADAAGGVDSAATTTTGSSTTADLSDAALGGIVVGAVAAATACCSGLFFVAKRLRRSSSSD